MNWLLYCRMSSVSVFDEDLRSSPLLLSEEVSEAQTKCTDSVCGQSCPVPEGNEDSRPLQERISSLVHEEQCDSTVVSDDLGSHVPSASGKKKHKVKTIKLKDEHLDLRCEWRDCAYHTCNLDHFVRHVSLHIPQLLSKANEAQKGTVFPRFCCVL
jgi:hypothetical protein